MPYTLIIDDDDVSIIILTKMMDLNHFGSKPLFFKNGQEALDFLQNNYNDQDSYIIFLDLNMPLMNGWEFLANVAPIVKPHNFFVFVLSSSTEEADKEHTESYAFVKQFISKPITKKMVEEIKSKIDL